MDSKDTGEIFSTRLKSVQRADNPLLAAATPLLYFLAHPPVSLECVCIHKVRASLILEVKMFTQICQSAQVPRTHMVTAQYVLCTAIDEMIQLHYWNNSPSTEDINPWSHSSLLTIFHKENYGGDKFFLLIGRLATQPEEYLDLLELMLVILGVGFKGRYRQDPDGVKHIESVRTRLLKLVESARGVVPKALSVRWAGANQEQMRVRKKVPWWLWGALTSICLFGQFAFYKLNLLEDIYRLEENIAGIAKMDLPTFLEMHHHSHLTLEQFLKHEIAMKMLTIEESDGLTKIVLKGDSVFHPGSSHIDRMVERTIAGIAQKVAHIPVKVVVEGHTDGNPLKGGPYHDNQRLSLARAQAVADILMEHHVGTERIHVIGKGDAEPVADNTSAEGRALNRRVVLYIRFQ